MQNQIKELNNEKSELQITLKEAELNDQSHRSKLKYLEDLLKRLESGVSKLQNSSEREDVLNEQIQRLENQLAEVLN